jgi:putative glutamine amidotransferase
MAKRVLIPFRHAHKVKPYLEAAQSAGLDAVAGDVTQPQSLDGFDGLLLMGGTDVNPGRYHQAPHRETDPPDDARDEVEIALISQALTHDLPILAICRGLQVLNVYHGGTLVQHLPSAEKHGAERPDKSAPVHEIRIQQPSLLAEIAGTTTWPVNSRHHQAVDRIGSGLVVSARDAEDGVIEAVERRDKRFVLAVQWHPEDQALHSPEQRQLFRRFAEAM